MKKLRYLHCLLDDKFIDGAISLFETDDSVKNDYVLFHTDAKSYSIQRIKNPVVVVDSLSNFLKKVIDYDVVILHDLKSLPLNLIAAIPEPIKVVWFMWGFDFYNNYICDIRLLHPVTYKSRFLSNMLGYLRDKVDYWCKKRKLYDRALTRIDYFSGVFPYEYNLFKGLKHYSSIKAKPLDFYYGSTDFFIPEAPSLDLNNKHINIIIGNSADICNNTLDVFEEIRDVLDVSDIEHIIVPLSYGGNRSHISLVKKTGFSMWGQKFKPLDKYLPLEEYLSLISNCKSAVFFHERQQASDNVFLQLLYGARVFMSESSLMYQYLKDKGYILFALQKDAKLINKPLSYDEVMINRSLLSKNYSSKRIIERVLEINRELLHDFEKNNRTK